MKTAKELLDGIINRALSKITTDASADTIKAANDEKTEAETIKTEFETLEDENKKLKEAVVKLALNTGSKDIPAGDPNPGEPKPKTLDEIIAEEAAKGGK